MLISQGFCLIVWIRLRDQFYGLLLNRGEFSLGIFSFALSFFTFKLRSLNLILLQILPVLSCEIKFAIRGLELSFSSLQFFQFSQKISFPFKV